MTGLLGEKTAVITGGAEGIGAEIAKLFLQHGANVVICDINVASGEALASAHDRLVFVQGDVRGKGFLASVLATAVERFGAVHVWVNNAGIVLDETKGKIKWREMVDINLCAVMEGTQLAVEHMSAHGGMCYVINMGSMAALIPSPLAPVYSATKAGVVQFTRSTGGRLGANSNVKAVCVCPSFVNTRMFQQHVTMAQKHLKSETQVLLSPMDVALGVFELVIGLAPGSIRTPIVSADASVLQRIEVPNGSTMRIFNKNDVLVRDLYNFPVALGGRSTPTEGRKTTSRSRL